jgi:hypothetical protein
MNLNYLTGKCALNIRVIFKDHAHNRLCRKEVEFGEGSGKVLLSRLGGEIHATSAFCTHYGAPLVKGILTADCRVVWRVFNLLMLPGALTTIPL